MCSHMPLLPQKGGHEPAKFVQDLLCVPQQSLIPLLLQGVEHMVVHVDLADKPQWYSRVTPAELVPAVGHQGHVHTESIDICRWAATMLRNPAAPARLLGTSQAVAPPQNALLPAENIPSLSPWWLPSIASILRAHALFHAKLLQQAIPHCDVVPWCATGLSAAQSACHAAWLPPLPQSRSAQHAGG